MKYKFEIKKENRSIIWKILFLFIFPFMQLVFDYS